MGIARFTASADNTITNAFKSDLITRATGANMGLSDILEVFSIYAQADSTSTEESRILINFPMTPISSSRVSGSLPESGSVSFYLKMFNAEHGRTLPRDYVLEIRPVQSGWEEGYGLDMDGYTDETNDGTGSNWVNCSASTNGQSGVPWLNQGGDYWGADDVSSSFTASFPVGNENLEVDITSLVEQWMQNVTGSTGKPNYGFGIMLSSSHSSDARSFYTKKFFGRDSEFFFKRPVIEARWDSSYRDDRNNFYLSSSMVPLEENLNTLFLYNYVRGQLRDIPTIATNGEQIFVSIFSGNAENTELSGSALLMSVGGNVSNTTNALTSVATGSRIDTGIYTASVSLTGTSNGTTLTNLFDVWYTSSKAAGDLRVGINPLLAKGDSHGIGGINATIFRTGSIKPKTFDSFNINPSTDYVTSVTNLKPTYSRNERARFRTFTRTKDWSPTIYTKASTDVEMTTPDSASFSVYRIIDDLEVISHGTGSRGRNDLRGNKSVYADDNETVMSFDVSGSYFDIDMNMLEPGYAYGIKFSYYNGGLGSWVEQPEKFKFRVE